MHEDSHISGINLAREIVRTHAAREKERNHGDVTRSLAKSFSSFTKRVGSRNTSVIPMEASVLEKKEQDDNTVKVEEEDDMVVIDDGKEDEHRAAVKGYRYNKIPCLMIRADSNAKFLWDLM